MQGARGNLQVGSKELLLRRESAIFISLRWLTYVWCLYMMPGDASSFRSTMTRRSTSLRVEARLAIWIWRIGYGTAKPRSERNCQDRRGSEESFGLRRHY